MRSDGDVPRRLRRGCRAVPCGFGRVEDDSGDRQRRGRTDRCVRGGGRLSAQVVREECVMPRAAVTQVTRRAVGIVTLTLSYLGERFEGQMWGRCFARKAAWCSATGEEIDAGELVYRSMTNAANRACRIKASWIDGRC